MALYERSKGVKFRKRRCDGRTRGREDELEFGGRGYESRMQAVVEARKKRVRLSLEFPEEMSPGQHLDFRLLVSGAVREYIYAAGIH